MPGVSSMQPVSGMDGIGKIYLKFKPKPKPKFPFGALLFLLTASAYFLVYLHSVTWTRHAFVIPFLRTIIGSYGFIGSLILPSEIFMEGPSSSVHIFKNIDGVHHVSAESIDDAMFGQGYLHAWNHLYALEMRRRAARGRLAEVEGYQSVQSDRVARVLDFEAMAKKDVSAESEENQRLLHNFAKGINAFITSRRFPSLSLLILGIVSVEEWTPEDTMMLLRLDAFTSSLAIQRSILNMTLHIGVTPEAAAEMLHVLGGHDLSTVVSRDVTKEMSLKSSFETAWAYIRPSGGAPIFATSLSSLVRIIVWM